MEYGREKEKRKREKKKKRLGKKEKRSVLLDDEDIKINSFLEMVG